MVRVYISKLKFSIAKDRLRCGHVRASISKIFNEMIFTEEFNEGFFSIVCREREFIVCCSRNMM